MRRLEALTALGALCGALAAPACAPNDWRTDMWYQPQPRPQQDPRPAPPDSIPVQGIITADDRDDLADLENPIPADAASVARGKLLFENRCSACHGLDGRGNGPVSKVFPPAPDVTYDAIRRRSDGFIFATITLGGRAMPVMREGLRENDRWDIVNFIRALQKSVPPTGGTP